jgi:hypothetical protein
MWLEKYQVACASPTVVFDPLPTQRGYSTLAVDLNMVTQPLTMIKETLPSGFHRTAEPIG